MKNSMVKSAECNISQSLLELKHQLANLDLEDSIKSCRYLRTMELHDETSLLIYAKNASKAGILGEALWAYSMLSKGYEKKYSSVFLINYYTFLNKTRNYEIAANHYLKKVILNPDIENKVANDVNNFIYKKYNIDFLDNLIFILKEQDINLSKESLDKLGRLVINLRKKGLRYSFPIGKIIEKNDKYFFTELFNVQDRMLFGEPNEDKDLFIRDYHDIEYSIGIVFNIFIANRFMHLPKPYKGSKIGFFTDSLEMGGNERNAVFTCLESKYNNTYKNTYLLHYSNSDIYNHWSNLIDQNKLNVINLSKEVELANESWIEIRIDFINRVFKDCNLIIKDFTDQLRNMFLNLIKLDLDHIHCFCSDTRCIMMGIAASLAGIPIISINPGSMSPATRPKIKPETEYLMISGYKALLKLSNVNLFSCSIAASLDYRKWLNQEDSDKFHVNYVSIITDNFFSCTVQTDKKNLPRKKEDEVIIVGCFRFHPVKRPLLWIEIALHLAEKYENANFYLVGDGALLEECKSKVNNSIHYKRFHFLGAVKDPSYIYDYADITYMTSVSEGLGNVILEAESFGVVPVVPYVGGMPETVVHAKNGFIVKLQEDDYSEMLYYLGRLIEDKSLRNNCSKFAKSFVKANFGPNTMLNNVLTVKFNEKMATQEREVNYDTIN